jgi:hypothetical protein
MGSRTLGDHRCHVRVCITHHAIQQRYDLVRTSTLCGIRSVGVRHSTFYRHDIGLLYGGMAFIPCIWRHRNPAVVIFLQ